MEQTKQIKAHDGAIRAVGARWEPSEYLYPMAGEPAQRYLLQAEFDARALEATPESERLETVVDLVSGLASREEVAELVGLAYAIGRNRGGLEGAVRVANQIGVS